MKRLSFACLAAAILAPALGLAAAETAKLRYVAAVYFDEKGGGFNLPEAVACGANGEVVVGDTGHGRLVRFTMRDGTVSGGREIKVPELAAPYRLQVNSKGQIYALDGSQRRIVVLDSSGAFEKVLGFAGVPPPATVVPKSLTIDAAGNIYVLDIFGGRVLVLDAEGRFQRALPLPADARFVSDVAVDTAGNLAVLDSVGRRLLSAARDADAFTPLGGDLRRFLASLPTYMTASRGIFFVVEGAGGGISSFGRDGSFLSRQLTAGWKEGALSHPSQICVDGQENLFVADRDNSRVQVFRLTR